MSVKNKLLYPVLLASSLSCGGFKDDYSLLPRKILYHGEVQLVEDLEERVSRDVEKGHNLSDEDIVYLSRLLYFESAIIYPLNSFLHPDFVI